MNSIQLIILLIFSVNLVCAFNAKRLVQKQEEYPTPLNPNNFDDYVYDKEYATLVEFYSSYCGYCKRLAPRYAAFAENVINWSPVVKIAKVNCEDLANIKLCRKHKSKTYPTFRFFGAYHKHDEDGVHIPIEDSDKLKPAILRQITIEKLQNYLATKQKPDKWPQLYSMQASSTNEIFSKLPTQTEKTIIAVLEKKTNIGAEVILDLSEHADKLAVFSFKLSPQLLSSFVSGDDDVYLLRITDDKSKYFEILKSFRFKPESTAEETVAQSETMRKCIVGILVNNYVRKNEKKDQPLTMVDLYNGIRHSLYHNVALRKEINRNEVAVLIKYTDILVRYFPFKEEEHRKSIKQINDWLKQQQTTGKDIDILEYDKFLQEQVKFPPARPYIKCLGSQPDLRGYSCALWSLFHTLTVAEYKNLSKTDGAKHEVLYVMREFIYTFFTCKFCARHFYNMSAEFIDNEILTHPNSSVLWLWKGHNKVNKRLQCDLSEDPESPKIQFPSHSSCPKCHTQTEKWNENAVLGYLNSYYSAENIINRANGVKVSNFLILLFMLITILIASKLKF
ncbi:sulfhydryl oxidase 1-like isoform X1 [Dinothrombium tinctorium]|uniref:Sulfhydryl oxidase n=1 Tax=Dinothrombium tinctorium TaxID=1965070 RepID=A0A3S3QPK7_9ACAR|nr:sulfhydryl oxidase 1-like isoform X1 [Dinothrombium tinctorium]